VRNSAVNDLSTQIWDALAGASDDTWQLDRGVKKVALMWDPREKPTIPKPFSIDYRQDYETYLTENFSNLLFDLP
jgi:hypothetical protein